MKYFIVRPLWVEAVGREALTVQLQGKLFFTKYKRAWGKISIRNTVCSQEHKLHLTLNFLLKTTFATESLNHLSWLSSTKAPSFPRDMKRQTY